MDRAVVIAFAVLGLAIAAAMGAGVGFIYFATSPASQVQQMCARTHCRNLKFTLSTPNRVEYTYDLPDGSQCSGYQEVRRGVLGMPSGGSGGSGCGPNTRARPTIGGPAPLPTPR